MWIYEIDYYELLKRNDIDLKVRQVDYLNRMVDVSFGSNQQEGENDG